MLDGGSAVVALEAMPGSLRPAALVYLLWFSAAAAGGPGPTLDYRLRIDREPALGTTAEAVVGGPLYLEQSLPELPIARLAAEAVVTAGGERWPAGKVLWATRLESQRWFCDPARNQPRLDSGLTVPRAGAAADRHLCVRDADEDGAFDRVSARGYEPPERFAPVAYELAVCEPVGPFQGKAFRRHLVYLGAGAGRLRVAYIESVEEVGAPASYGELDLALEESPDGPPEIGLRGVRIQVLELPGAPEGRIRYRVTRGFGESGAEAGQGSRPVS